ncbi:hypothetical protein T484DRAFT_1767824 [Baffinella frigidus]|nr:hypothetical protein T484DRAFT_1767824 [Cryptophyta sp. CCMP2293]
MAMPKALEAESSLCVDPGGRSPGFARSGGRNGRSREVGPRPASTERRAPGGSPFAGTPGRKQAKANHSPLSTAESSPCVDPGGSSPGFARSVRGHGPSRENGQRPVPTERGGPGGSPYAGTPRRRQPRGNRSPMRGSHERGHSQEGGYTSEEMNGNNSPVMKSSLNGAGNRQSWEMKKFDSKWAVMPVSTEGAKTKRKAHNKGKIESLMAAANPGEAGMPPRSPLRDDSHHPLPIHFISRRFATPGATHLDRWRYRVRLAAGASGSPIASTIPIRRTQPAFPPGGWAPTRLERWRQRVRKPGT